MIGVAELESAVAVGEVISSIDEQEAARERWMEQRSGKFTCSRFGDLMGILRKKSDDWTQTALTYLHQIAAERLGSFKFEFDSASVRHGREYEAEAIETYIGRCMAKASDITTGEGCWSEVSGWVGGTPDALIGFDGCLEVKCPYTPEEHIGYLVGGVVPAKYRWQVIGHMFVTGRKWCDFVSFDPRMPEDQPKRMLIVRTKREEVTAELDSLAATLKRAQEYVEGVIQ